MPVPEAQLFRIHRSLAPSCHLVASAVVQLLWCHVRAPAKRRSRGAAADDSHNHSKGNSSGDGGDGGATADGDMVGAWQYSGVTGALAVVLDEASKGRHIPRCRMESVLFGVRFRTMHWGVALSSTHRIARPSEYR